MHVVVHLKKLYMWAQSTDQVREVRNL